MVDISLQQFEILSRIMAGDVSASDLREHLRQNDSNYRDAAFSRMMSRLHRTGLVDVRVDESTLGRRGYPERIFSITEQGRIAWEQAYEFFLRNAATAGRPVQPLVRG